MEVKVAGRQFERVASRQAGDLKRALNRRTKVKVSALLSPESQKAMLMVQEETYRQGTMTQEEPVAPAVVTSTAEVHCATDSNDVIETDYVGLGAVLDRVCTIRLHGDITDKNFTPKMSRKRALRSGDRLHTAMEVVEIVRRDCDDDDNMTQYDDTDDEQEAIQRVADLNSHQRCQAWLQLHFRSHPDHSGCYDAER